MNYKQAVCALIKHKEIPGLYLGVSRKDDHTKMGMAGGKVEPGETLEQAIIREVKEETGLDITNLKRIFSRKARTLFCTTFSADYSGTICTEEKGLVKWITKEELFNGSHGEYNKRLFEALRIK